MKCTELEDEQYHIIAYFKNQFKIKGVAGVNKVTGGQHQKLKILIENISRLNSMTTLVKKLGIDKTKSLKFVIGISGKKSILSLEQSLKSIESRSSRFISKGSFIDIFA